MRATESRMPGTLLVAAIAVLAIALLAGEAAAQLETRARQRSPALLGGGVAPFGISYTAPGLEAGLGSVVLAAVPLPAGTLKNLRVFVKPGAPVQNNGAAVVQVLINNDETGLVCGGLVGICTSAARVTVNDGDLLVVRVNNALFFVDGPPVPVAALPFSYSIEFE